MAPPLCSLQAHQPFSENFHGIALEVKLMCRGIAESMMATWWQPWWQPWLHCPSYVNFLTFATFVYRCTLCTLYRCTLSSNCTTLNLIHGSVTPRCPRTWSVTFLSALATFCQTFSQNIPLTPLIYSGTHQYAALGKKIEILQKVSQCWFGFQAEKRISFQDQRIKLDHNKSCKCSVILR